ncbi:unnamed protein product [Prorocentrum cordatum]|uniref:Uncharacterized protein n=1 Tax=Prorocentrum cordatum TaxID=2364126 RepID=A0ABN9WA48_9DINO|nr:unnamed protein product [Polarella glacialis]
MSALDDTDTLGLNQLRWRVKRLESGQKDNDKGDELVADGGKQEQIQHLGEMGSDIKNPEGGSGVESTLEAKQAEAKALQALIVQAGQQQAPQVPVKTPQQHQPDSLESAQSLAGCPRRLLTPLLAAWLSGVDRPKGYADKAASIGNASRAFELEPRFGQLCSSMGTILINELKKVGFRHNLNKRELATEIKLTENLKLKAQLANGSGRIIPHARRLGGRYVWNDNANLEVGYRIDELKKGWLSMGRLWFAKGGAQVAHDTHAKVLTNKELMKRWGVVPARAALAMQRVRWLQDMVRHPLAHQQVIAALWGHLEDASSPTDVEGKMTVSTSPYARQFTRDPMLLEAISGTEDFFEEWVVVGRAWQEWWSCEDVSKAFLKVDAKLLEVPLMREDRLWEKLAPKARETEEAQGEYVCDLLDVQGAVCGLCFDSLKKLVTHMTKAAEGAAGEWDAGRRVKPRSEDEGGSKDKWLKGNSATKIPEQTHNDSTAVKKDGQRHPHRMPCIWALAGLIEALKERGSEVGGTSAKHIVEIWERWHQVVIQSCVKVGMSRKQGKAPASFMERELQEYVGQLLQAEEKDEKEGKKQKALRGTMALVGAAAMHVQMLQELRGSNGQSYRRGSRFARQPAAAVHPRLESECGNVHVARAMASQAAGLRQAQGAPAALLRRARRGRGGRGAYLRQASPNHWRARRLVLAALGAALAGLTLQVACALLGWWAYLAVGRAGMPVAAAGPAPFGGGAFERERDERVGSR